MEHNYELDTVHRIQCINGVSNSKMHSRASCVNEMNLT